MGVWQDRAPWRYAVHDHLEFCRKLHREIARLRAAQDAIHIGGGATKVVYPVRTRNTSTPLSLVSTVISGRVLRRRSLAASIRRLALQRIPVKLTHSQHVESSCDILHEKV